MSVRPTAQRKLEPNVERSYITSAGHVHTVKIKEVLVDEESGTATVVVPDYQLSLAIGKEGQNARLAARMTGWRVDIKSETEVADEAAYEQVDWAEGEWVVNEETGEQVWQPADGGAAMSVEEWSEAVAGSSEEIVDSENPLEEPTEEEPAEEEAPAEDAPSTDAQICPICSTSNPAGATTCENCGFGF